MSDSKTLHILLAGGGTGGHVMPIANVIQTIESGDYPPHKLYRYGSKKSLEYTISQKLNQTLSTPVIFRSLSSGKIRRDRSFSSFLHNIRDMIRVIRGTLQALYYLRRDHIDVIWCKGGYVAGPVIFASRIWGIPLIVHESDTRMGLINRLASRHAKAIFTAFDNVHNDAQVVGQLLSDDFAHERSRTDFATLIGHQTQANQTHVLVM
ncbi:MAG: glycosyltransferase [Candidatus Peribacteria bacterium]|nr:MAG: glycosyltransferase [Candidatus Peribacteria bacterium]